MRKGTEKLELPLSAAVCAGYHFQSGAGSITAAATTYVAVAKRLNTKAVTVRAGLKNRADDINAITGIAGVKIDAGVAVAVIGTGGHAFWTVRAIPSRLSQLERPAFFSQSPFVSSGAFIGRRKLSWIHLG